MSEDSMETRVARLEHGTNVTAISFLILTAGIMFAGWRINTDRTHNRVACAAKGGSLLIGIPDHCVKRDAVIVIE